MTGIKESHQLDTKYMDQKSSQDVLSNKSKEINKNSFEGIDSVKGWSREYGVKGKCELCHSNSGQIYVKYINRQSKNVSLRIIHKVICPSCKNK